jgi:hypothetical protein
MSDSRSRSSSRTSLAAIPVALALFGCGLMMSQEDQAKLAKACEGEAVEGAGAYAGGGDGFMTFVKKDASSPFEWSVDGVHFKLKKSTKLADTHAVFCLEPVEEVDEGLCAFDTIEGIGVAGVQVIDVKSSKGPTFPRVSMQRKGRIVDPSTGETIAEHTVKQEAPKCDAFTGEPVKENFRAIEPTGISFADWALEQVGVEG